MLRFRNIIAAAAIAATIFTTGTFALGRAKGTAHFKVRVENVSDRDGIIASDGSKYPFALSPGLYVVTKGQIDLFSVGNKAGTGIEAQAEDGDPGTLLSSVSTKLFEGSFGEFNTPAGASSPGPLLPGGYYEFSFNASRGMKLNLVTMFGQSNDLFYAPTGAIELFDKKGNPKSGDITGEFLLWDAGTEVNQAPGIGSDQGPRQKMKNTGAAENGVVGLVKDGFDYPNTKNVMRITITAN